MSMRLETGRATPADIIDVIRREFQDRFAGRQIDPAAHLTSDLGLDSMDIVRLLVSLEDRFSIRFDPDAVDLDAVFTSPDTLATHIGNECGG
ncbi:acyl carrier protein [Azospirillum sp. BE72]|uniref:acyl carrier protein n=1 Tax=Azospirillum sp. BE72 TaxID=2817776 RepID=UPI00285F57FF|nr:acyl carrier protein [Azospirillum sp. BE72]MDR6774839.1 acyl carrier protein [Azospirillum sp. BE72]